MAYTRTIICFANSVKTGGRCVAGKGGDGKWIRPVSMRPSGEVQPSEYTYQGGGVPQLLDRIKIEFEKEIPHAHQTENQMIAKAGWMKVGTAPYGELAGLLDTEN